MKRIVLVVTFALLALTVAHAQPAGLAWNMSEREVLAADSPISGSAVSPSGVDYDSMVQLTFGRHITGIGRNPEEGYSMIITRAEWVIGDAYVAFHFFDNQLFQIRAVWPHSTEGIILRDALSGRYGGARPGSKTSGDDIEWQTDGGLVGFQDRPNSGRARLTYTSPLTAEFAAIARQRRQEMVEAKEAEREQRAQEAESGL